MQGFSGRQELTQRGASEGIDGKRVLHADSRSVLLG